MTVALLALVLLAPQARPTWSIVVVDTRTGEMAVASATCVGGIDLKRYLAVVYNDVGVAAAQSAVDVGAIKFAVPTDWTTQTPKSSMRRAQLEAPGAGGAAELIVYYFGPQGAGSTEDNVKRWIGQFGDPSAEDALTKATMASFAGPSFQLANASLFIEPPPAIDYGLLHLSPLRSPLVKRRSVTSIRVAAQLVIDLGLATGR